jgi:hypothetical protein
MTAARYEVVTAIFLNELQAEVQSYLEAGWLPAGGVSQSDRNGAYLQAVYWREE